MNNEYIDKCKMTIPFKPLKLALEKAKNLKTDVVLVPQFPCGTFPSIFMGMSSNSILSVGNFDEFDYTKPEKFINTLLWGDNSLTHIDLYIKDINPFLKIITDTAESEAREELNIKDPKVKTPKEEIENHLPEEASLYYNRYIVNGAQQSIGTSLEVYDKDGKIMSNTLGNNTVTSSYINLFNSGISENIAKIKMIFQYARKVINDVDVTDDPLLNQIIQSKATEGAKLWVPSVNITNISKYMMYINKAFLNISKGDKVLLSVYDNIPTYNDKYFMVSFDIDKPKKGIHLTTSFMAFKLN